MRRPPRASLAAAAIVVLAGVWAAGGGDKLKTLDLLDLPGPATSRGAHKLLLDVGAGGPGLVAVGEMGLMLASADQGRTWTQQPSPSSVMYTGVSFVDARTGWAVGHDGVIVATTDGGRSWKRQFDGRKANEAVLAAARAHLERLNAQAGNDEAGAKKKEQAEDALGAAQAAIDAGPSTPLFAVRFLDARRGIVAGAFGQLFSTDDAGTSWHYIGDRLDNPEGLHLNGLMLGRDGSLYLAAEAGTVFISRDHGENWTRSQVGYEGHLYGVVPLDENTLLAYGFKGRVFRSTDRGATWARLPQVGSKTLVQAAVADGRVLLLAEDGQLYETRQAGVDFVPLGLPLALGKFSSFTLAGDTLVGVGSGGVSLLPLKKMRTAGDAS
jgi:photosystem II stability/assembly factor-like uncharacterized protein